MVMKRTGSLKHEEDAYGQEIWAYHQGREVFEIVERDDGYISAASVLPKMYFSEYEDWPPHEKKAMEFVKGRVLDIGCGAGRHSLSSKQRFRCSRH
jgi:SAM-dependent methyltransferase